MLGVEVGGTRRSVQWIQQYHGGLLHAEHGNRFAMFNARDRINDPVGGLPLGYFVSRILAGRSDYESPAAIATYVDDLLESVFTTTTIAESL